METGTGSWFGYRGCQRDRVCWFGRCACCGAWRRGRWPLPRRPTAASAPPLTSLAVQSGAALAQPPGRVVVMNREIVTLRGSLFGIPAVTRAAEGEERIRKALRRGGDLKVESTQIAEGVLVRLDGALMFAVTPDDSEERTLAGARAKAGEAAAMLQLVIDESRESRNLKSLLTAALVTLGSRRGHAGADVAAAQGAPAHPELADRADAGPCRPAACRRRRGGAARRAAALRAGVAEPGVLGPGAAAGLRVAEPVAGAVSLHPALGRAAERLPVRAAEPLRAGHRACHSRSAGRGADLLAGLGADARAARLLRQGRRRPGARQLARRRRGVDHLQTVHRRGLAVRACDGLPVPAGLRHRGLQGACRCWSA